MSETSATEARSEFLRHARKELIELGIEGFCTVEFTPEYAAEVTRRTRCTLAELSKALGVEFTVANAD